MRRPPLLAPLRLAVALLPLAAAAAGAQSLGGTEFSYTGAGFALLDPGTASSDILVSGFGAGAVMTRNGAGQTVVARINNFTHTWVGDVTVRLTFIPVVGGVVALDLFARPGVGAAGSQFGSSKDLNGSYSFGEFVEGTTFETDFVDVARFSAPTAIAGGDFYATTTLGEYQSPFAAFGGLTPNGAWRLSVIDAAGGDTGAVGSWSLGFNVVPEPSTYALLGAGLLTLGAAARRRGRAPAAV